MNKLSHRYTPEILVPYCALEDNINFILNGTGQYITSDGVIVEAKRITCVHALSTEAERLINVFYGMSVVTYLYEWYRRNGGYFSELELLHIKLEQ